AELSGTAAQSRVLLAASITLAEIEQRFATSIERRDDITFDAVSGSLRGRRSERLGAVTLVERPYAVTPSPEATKQLAEGIIRLVGADRVRRGGGPEARHSGAGTVRPRPPSEHRRRQGAAGRGTSFTGAAARPGDARSAGFLARLLCGGEDRHARPLPPPSLA